METRRNFLRWVGGSIAALPFARKAHALAGDKSALKAAADALGADAIHTLQFTAAGATFSVGQNFTPSDPWPRVPLKRYTALIDYDNNRMRQDLVREMGATMPRGGGVPFTGERRQIQMYSGNYTWDVPVPADPAAGSLPGDVPGCSKGRVGACAGRPGKAHRGEGR